MTDAEWALVATYLALMRDDALQREHYVWEVFHALRGVVRSSSATSVSPKTEGAPEWGHRFGYDSATKDDERMHETVAGLKVLVFACLAIPMTSLERC